VILILSLILALIVALLLVSSAESQDNTEPVYDYELELGDRPLNYLGLAGESCQIGVEPGFYDSWYPDKWFCHGWSACEPYWTQHGFSLSGTATYGGRENMPIIYCGKPEDSTLYLYEGMTTFLDHELVFPLVHR
jgi:hypothetical protein